MVDETGPDRPGGKHEITTRASPDLKVTAQANSETKGTQFSRPVANPACLILTISDCLTRTTRQVKIISAILQEEQLHRKTPEQKI